MITILHFAIGLTLAHANTETGDRVPQTEAYHMGIKRLTDNTPVTPSTEERRPQNEMFYIKLQQMRNARVANSELMKYHLELLKAMNSGKKQAYEPSVDRQLQRLLDGSYNPSALRTKRTAYEPSVDRQLQRLLDGTYNSSAPRTKRDYSLIEKGACVVVAGARGQDYAKSCGDVAGLEDCAKAKGDLTACVTSQVRAEMTKGLATPTRVAEAQEASAGR